MKGRVALLGVAAFVVTQVAAAPTPSQWTSLNQTVGGRLFRGIPLAEPCYSNYNGTPVTPNAAQCATVENGYKSDTFIVQSYSGFLNVNWGSCQRVAQGCPLDYTLPQNPIPLLLSQECHQGSVSPYYIDVRQLSDIQAGLAFAKKYKVDLSIKNSGHDYKGRSAAPDSLALWTHNVRPDPKLVKNFIPDGCSIPVGDGVTFGAGQEFAGLYQFADQNNITIVGGSSPTVGPAGGWITGAGHSALSNNFGLGVDNVLQIRGVLPNGQYVTANQCQNPDLWFAWRGGGGSTFGVNWEVTFKANPKVKLEVAYVRFASLDPQSLKKFISICIQNANKWASEGWGGYIEPGAVSAQSSGFVLTTPSLSHDQAVLSMKPITDYVVSLGNLALSNEVVTVDGYYSFFNTYILPNAELNGLSTAVGSRLIPASQFNGTANQNALLDTLVAVSEMLTFPTRGTTDPSLLTYGAPLQFLVTAPSSYPTTAARDTSAVTPAWRDATWHILANVPFANTASVSDIQAAFQTAHNVTELLRALVPDSGAYQNEADVFQVNPAEAFWGQKNYDRLLRIKKSIDPGNILTCWDCIGWDSSAARFGCYPQIQRSS